VRVITRKKLYKHPQKQSHEAVSSSETLLWVLAQLLAALCAKSANRGAPPQPSRPLPNRRHLTSQKGPSHIFVGLPSCRRARSRACNSGAPHQAEFPRWP